MSPHDVIAMIAEAHGLTVQKLKGPRRWSSYVAARKEAARQLREDGLSYPEIGRALGGRDHVTAMNLCGVLKPRTEEQRQHAKEQQALRAWPGEQS